MWVSGQTNNDSLRQITIRHIHITGNNKTIDRIITREIEVQPGMSYSLKRVVDSLEYDRYRIYNTNLFNEVEVSLAEIPGDSADILVDVEERWYFYPVPLFRPADRSFVDWWYNQNGDLSRVNYGLRLTQWNFRGRAERLRIEAQTGFEDRLSLNYKIPYIDRKQRHGLIPEIFYFTSKNLGYATEDHLRQFIMADEQMRRSVGVSVIHTYRKKFYEYHFTSLGFFNTHINDTIAFLNPNYLGDGRTRQLFMTASYGYGFDTRDNINFPLSGHTLFGSVSKSGLGIFKDVDFWSSSLAGSKFWNLGKGFYQGSYLQGYWSTDGDRALLNFYGLGFEPQILARGYDRDLIEGRAFLLSKNSTRFRLWQRKYDISRVMPLQQFQTFPIAIYGKLFYDAAYVWGFEGYENNDRLTNKAIYGIGAGLDIVSMYDFVIRLEYSTNRAGQQQFFVNFGADF